MNLSTEKLSDRPLFIIASNRGPFKFSKNEAGTFDVERGSGGLVTALSALVEKHDVQWYASAISEGDYQWAAEQRKQVQPVEGINLSLITPDKAAYYRYYNVISNPLLWFIQHQLWDIPRTPSITSETWTAWDKGYRAINRLFAEKIAAQIKDVDRPVFIFPQDYHLYLLPAYLRELLGDRVQIQPFLHIPWPGPDAWRILPDQIRSEILLALLESDRVGFQTSKDAFNFVQTCRFYLENAHSRGDRYAIHIDGRRVEAKAYPISVDNDNVRSLAEEAQTQLMKNQMMSVLGDRKLILRVDRIEPSKNILRGLEAYETFLANYPEYRGKVMMMALLVPSRMEVDEYQDYLREIMAQAGMINARYSDAFWEPVRVIVGNNYHRALAAMQLYDVLLVNPIADGMNLVAKEGVLVNLRNGALVLSENAGVYFEFQKYSINVSPFDVYSTAEAIYRGLEMSAGEKERRAEGLRTIIQSGDVRNWFADQVDDALIAFNNQASNSDTPATPSTRQSVDSPTAVGISADQTPTAAVTSSASR